MDLKICNEKGVRKREGGAPPKKVSWWGSGKHCQNGSIWLVSNSYGRGCAKGQVMEG